MGEETVENAGAIQKTLTDEKHAKRAENFPVAIDTNGNPLQPIPHPDAIPATANPQVDHRGFLAKLFGRRQKPAVPENQISQVAIDTKGDALHGIGSEVTEEELRKLEGSETKQSTTGPEELPPLAQKSVNKLLDKYPPVVESVDESNQHDVDSDSNELGIGDRKITPINESVVVPS